MKNTILILIFVSIFCLHGNCSRIFAVFMFPSVSHQVIFQPIWKELSLRGHQVTVVTPNPLKDQSLTNLTEIDISFTYKLPEIVGVLNSVGQKPTLVQKMLSIFELNMLVFESEMKSQAIQEIIQRQNDKYDLVLLQYSHFANVMLPFAYKFNAPAVGISSLGVFLHARDDIGNPTHPVISPDYILGISGNMSFVERLKCFLYNLWYRALYYFYFLPRGDAIARTYFGDDMPYLGKLAKNLSLLLVSANPIIHTPTPNVPNIIEINQLHIKEKKPLPKDLQEFLDGSPQGAIYFSLGSNMKSVNLSSTLRKEITTALAELPYNVIWKWEDDHLADKPDNVLIKKWLPQQDILGHPNIKAFITQGGLQSIEEAIINEVPLVGIPFFSDQPSNMRKIEEQGIGRMIDYASLTKEKLKSAVIEVSQNKKYKENIKRCKSILVDQPTRGVDKAVWWIEYVLKHKGARHLRSPAADMSFFEYLMLDVISFLVMIIIIASYGFYKLIMSVKKALSVRKIKKS
ncbi:unnamed protein product [Phyllotreta striolata]|uniref:UDP-glucuronosyltransferase n=1 Tax=Phyllotreta striolata TaxID=444603 RepID=A0A9N9TP08_PHYSR|nr:unnamed protein product [Phyllotreta striolata]